MKKYSKRLLALLLSGILMLSPFMQTFAEENAASVSDNSVSAGDVEEPAAEEEPAEEEEDVTAPKEEDTVSDNEAEEPEEAPKEGLFPGMAEGYELSAYELGQKQSIGKELSDIGKFAEGADYEANQIIYPAEDEEDAKAKAAAFNAVLDSFDYGIAVAVLPDEASVYDAVAASADVKQLLPPVWPNYIHRALGEVVPKSEESELNENYELAAAAYNDPYLKETSSEYQWQHATVGSAYAWNSGYTGSGVKVAVLDTGIAQSHEDVSAVSAQNFVEGETTPYDGNNHGTHVSGIIGATANNGKGGAGIAPDSLIYSYRVLDNAGRGNEAQTARAIAAATKDKVDIINMSLGSPGTSGMLNSVLRDAYTAGVIVFAAAGNDGSNGLNYPACLKYVISVAATDIGNGKAYFSNYGPTVDLCAPGVDILSAVPGDYDWMSGTSQASPVAAGTAAVLLAANVKGVKDLSGSKRVDAMEKLMKDNTIKASGSQIGKGIVSLPKALKLSTAVTTPNKPVFSLKAGTYKPEQLTNNRLWVTIQAEPGMTIYYSLNGKTPSYKNGEVKNGTKANDKKTLPLSGSSVTVKAIAVNAVGKSSAVMSAKYTLKGSVESIQVTGPTAGTNSTEVLPGKSVTLKAVVDPVYSLNKAVDWSVDSTPEGITVKNGKVTVAKNAAPGTYTVRATAKDGTGISGRHSIVVKSAEDIKITKVAFKPSKATLYKGSAPLTYDAGSVLTITCKEGESANAAEMLWSSSNTKVAVVDSAGSVNVNAPGTAKITAATKDGNGKKATLTLTVKQCINDLSIYCFSANEGSSAISLGKGKSLSLKTASKTEGITEKEVSWSISPAGKGVTISKTGKVTAGKTAAAGSYTVTATAVRYIKPEEPASATRTIEVKEGTITSVSMPKTASVFRVKGNGHSNLSTSTLVDVTVNGSEGFDTSAWTVSSSSNIVSAEKISDKQIRVTANSQANPGTATITVKATDGSNKKATCKVTVLNPASSLKISQEAGRSQYLSGGRSLKMKATLGTAFGAASNKKIIWNVSDPTLATVDKNGKVTANKKGKTGVVAVQAQTADGSNLIDIVLIYISESIKRIDLSYNFVYGYYEVKINGKSFSDYINSNRIMICPDFDIKSSNPQSVSGVIQFDDKSGKCLLLPFGVEKAGTGSITVRALDGSTAKATVYGSYDGN